MSDHEDTIDNVLLLVGYLAIFAFFTGVGALCWALARRLWRGGK